MSSKRTDGEFRLEIKHRFIEPLELYDGLAKKILMRCLVCDHRWSATPGNVLHRKSGCPICARSKSAIKRARRNGIIKHHGDWLEVDVSTKAHPNAIMKIDAEDWLWLGRETHCGVYAYMGSNHKYPYAQTRVNGKTVDVHRLIFPRYKMIDHINRDGLDNRRRNLRECSASQNNMNKSKKNNSSGRVGVDKTPWGWRARIKVNGVEHHLGYFSDFLEACIEREKYEYIYFGEFA